MASRPHALDPVADEVRRHDEALRRAVVRMLLVEIDKVEDPEERRMLREDLARGRGDFSRERMELLVRDYERTLRERRALPRRRRRGAAALVAFGLLLAAGGAGLMLLASGAAADALGPAAVAMGFGLLVIAMLAAPGRPAEGGWHERKQDDQGIGMDWSRPDDTLIVSPTYRDLPENIWHHSDHDWHHSGYDR